jgi:hypothetical protein
MPRTQSLWTQASLAVIAAAAAALTRDARSALAAEMPASPAPLGDA